MSLVVNQQTKAVTKPRRRRRNRQRRGRRRGDPYMVMTSPNRYLLGGFPDSKKVKLRYCQAIRLDPSTANFAQHLFRCNAPQNPSYTSVLDHQPMYFDQWAAIYAKYCVMGSKIKLSWLGGSGSTQNTFSGLYGVYTATGTAGISAYSDIMGVLESNNNVTWRSAGNLNTGSSNPNKQNYVISKFSTRKFFGIKDPQDGNAYSAAVTTIPNQEAYWCCWFAAIDGDPASQNFLIEIEYLIEFSDRKSVDIS